MVVEKFRVEVDGLPVRFYINSQTKSRCIERDKVMYDTFSSRADAEKKATNWCLQNFVVMPFSRDLGTVTKLAEIGF